MSTFAQLLAKFLFAEFLAWAKVKDVDGLLAKGAVALKAELGDDLAKLDALPAAVAGLLGSQIAGIPNQFRALINQMLAGLPFPFNGVQI